jgi:hypothetical protein
MVTMRDVGVVMLMTMTTAMMIMMIALQTQCCK